MAVADLTAARLRELLHYDPETGIFTWVHGTRKSPAGSRAGYVMKGKNLGYRAINLEGCCYYEHRLAWLYMTGAWPQHQIDHDNHARTDNRWSNLFDRTPKENVANRPGKPSHGPDGRFATVGKSRLSLGI
jgi:hypothetical protein